MTRREYQILRWIEENPLISQQELAERAGITRSSVAVHISNLTKKGYIAGKGYLVRSAPYVAVIGGAGVSVSGRALGTMTAGEVTPAQVQMRLSGAGRNIAHNISLLGIETYLITALGDDIAARKLLESLHEQRVNTEYALRLPESATATDLILLDSDGRRERTLRDTESYAHLTPAVLEARLPFLNKAHLIVMDTSIPEESLRWLLHHCRVPVFVSAERHLEKLKELLGALHTLHVTPDEVEQLAGIPLTSRNNIGRAADLLLEYGLQRVFINFGMRGIFAADHHTRRFTPAVPGQLVNTDGCADAFAAALAWAWLEGMTLEQTIGVGLAVSSIVMESGEMVNPALCAAKVQQRCAVSRLKFQYPK